jgi:hypothetical protein
MRSRQPASRLKLILYAGDSDMNTEDRELFIGYFYGQKSVSRKNKKCWRHIKIYRKIDRKEAWQRKANSLKQAMQSPVWGFAAIIASIIGAVVAVATFIFQMASS